MFYEAGVAGDSSTDSSSWIILVACAIDQILDRPETKTQEPTMSLVPSVEATSTLSALMTGVALGGPVSSNHTVTDRMTEETFSLGGGGDGRGLHCHPLLPLVAPVKKWALKMKLESLFG